MRATAVSLCLALCLALYFALAAGARRTIHDRTAVAPLAPPPQPLADSQLETARDAAAWQAALSGASASLVYLATLAWHAVAYVPWAIAAAPGVLADRDYLRALWLDAPGGFVTRAALACVLWAATLFVFARLVLVTKHFFVGKDPAPLRSLTE